MIAGQYDRIVQPGQTGKVPLKMSTTGRAGRLSKPVTVYTNVPAPNASVTLMLDGDVWEAFTVEPPMVNFGRLTMEAAQARSLAQKVTITNNTDSPAELTGARSTNPLFHAELKTLDPGKKYELVVGLTGVPKYGSNSSALEIATGASVAPRLVITAMVVVLPDVEVAPARVTFPASRKAAMYHKITVRNNTKTPLKISDLETNNPGLKATLEETQPGMAFTIMLEVSPDAELAGGDKVSFHTDCPTTPNVVVFVTAARPPTTAPGQPASATSQPGVAPASQPGGGGGGG